MKKRILPLLITLAMLSVLTKHVVAAPLPYIWEESGGNITILDYSGNSQDLIIPSFIDGKPVTAISRNAFENSLELRTVSIPQSVTYIGSYAFRECPNLVSFDIPYGVTVIEDQTFAFCSSLTSVTIPESVTTIGDRAFDSCSSLAELTIPASVTSINPSNNGANAFSGCNLLTIKCYSDSAAEEYANQYWLNYILLDVPMYSVSGYVQYPGVFVQVGLKEAIADDNGYFNIQLVKPGSYDIIITKMGALRRFIPVTISSDTVLSDSLNKITLIQGDTNFDDAINVSDITEAKIYFGQIVGEVEQNPGSDVTFDGLINISDITAIKNNFGKTIHSY